MLLSSTTTSNTTAGAAAAAAAERQVLRVTAAHGAGTVDIAVETRSTHLIFEVVDLSGWTGADPIERHLAFGEFWTGVQGRRLSLCLALCFRCTVLFVRRATFEPDCPHLERHCFGSKKARLSLRSYLKRASPVSHLPTQHPTYAERRRRDGHRHGQRHQSGCDGQATGPVWHAWCN